MSDYGAPIAPAPPALSPSSDDSRSTGPTTTKPNPGAIIESTRKPRGRPPGSKNKPKPPIVITRDSENAMHPHVLELSAGSDVVETVSHFARRRNLGLSVLSATGTVANVTLRHPTSQTATLTIHGRFDILSLTGTCLPSPPSSNPSFSISLAGAQGQVIGGAVAGALVAAGPVIIIAASFITPSFHRLPSEEQEQEQEEENHNNAGSSALQAQAQVQPSCSMAIYNCQVPTDVLSWPPTTTTRSPY